MEAIAKTLEMISFIPYFLALFVIVSVTRIKNDKTLYSALKVLDAVAAISIVFSAISSWYINYHLGFEKCFGFFFAVIISSFFVFSFTGALKQRLKI